MDIIYAPNVSTSQTVYLKHLIAEHQAHFKMLFPESNMINKHHHMVHYPTCITMSGPMVSMKCMKFELKHGLSKRVASVNCNFKNICKSVACKHQVLQCTAWCNENMRTEMECLGGCMTAVESLDGSDVIKAYFHLAEDSEIFVATEVSELRTKYKENLFVATVVVSDSPQFALIRSILMCGRTSDEVYNLGFVAYFHAYEVDKFDFPEFIVSTPNDLLDNLPLSGLRFYVPNSPLYLCPR